MSKQEIETLYPVVPPEIITDRTTQLFVPLGHRLDITAQIGPRGRQHRAGMFIAASQQGYYRAGKLPLVPEAPPELREGLALDPADARPWLGPFTVGAASVESAPYYLLGPSVAAGNLYQAAHVDSSMHDHFGIIEMVNDWREGEDGLALNISKPLAPYLGVSALGLYVRPSSDSLHE